MTLRDLIDRLERIAEDLETDADHVEVRLALQPSWPFEHEIDDVIAVEVPAAVGAPDAPDLDTMPDLDVVIYISEQRQIGYLPGRVARELGWGKQS